MFHLLAVPPGLLCAKRDAPAQVLSCLVPANEAKAADHFNLNLSKYANGTADNRLLCVDRHVGDAGLFIAMHIRPEPQPKNSGDQAADHRPNPFLGQIKQLPVPAALFRDGMECVADDLHAGQGNLAFLRSNHSTTDNQLD